MTPPRFFFATTMSGGLWLSLRLAVFSSSTSTWMLVSKTSIIRRIRSADRTTDRTSRPLPLPFEASLISPGRSRTCIFAPLYSMSPGTHVSVVNLYAATSLVRVGDLVEECGLADARETDEGHGRVARTS